MTFSLCLPQITAKVIILAHVKCLIFLIYVKCINVTYQKYVDLTLCKRGDESQVQQQANKVNSTEMCTWQMFDLTFLVGKVHAKTWIKCNRRERFKASNLKFKNVISIQTFTALNTKLTEGDNFTTCSVLYVRFSVAVCNHFMTTNWQPITQSVKAKTFFADIKIHKAKFLLHKSSMQSPLEGIYSISPVTCTTLLKTYKCGIHLCLWY